MAMTTVEAAACGSLVVGCVAALVVAMRARAAGLGVGLHRLRADLYDAAARGVLPWDEPVRDLAAVVEHLAEHHRRLRLVDLVAYDAIDRYVRWRCGPVVAAPLAGVRSVPALAVVGAPVRVWAGLDEAEAVRLAGLRARLDGLAGTLVFTTSWSGLVVVAWFMATGLRSPRAAVAAADRSCVGRAARRGLGQVRPGGVPPWFR